jgi:hypothetical protein
MSQEMMNITLPTFGLVLNFFLSNDHESQQELEKPQL